jgi:hypothetical protein
MTDCTDVPTVGDVSALPRPVRPPLLWIATKITENMTGYRWVIWSCSQCGYQPLTAFSPGLKRCDECLEKARQYQLNSLQKTKAIANYKHVVDEIRRHGAIASRMGLCGCLSCCLGLIEGRRETFGFACLLGVFPAQSTTLHLHFSTASFCTSKRTATLGKVVKVVLKTLGTRMRAGTFKCKRFRSHVVII